MERIYKISLNLHEQIPDDLLRTSFKDYMHSLGIFVPEKSVIFGSNLILYTLENNAVWFTESSIGIQTQKLMEETEAVKFALRMARKLESAEPPFNPSLRFNPNRVNILIGRDVEWNYISPAEFLDNAETLQKMLYGGGDIAYEPQHNVFLGCEINSFAQERRLNIRNVEGTAQPANSLDELLARIEQK